MKINETIRKYRKEANLTQEQVANYLGVTAPAVNKWEKGSCYPDVTLLVPLARILKTDVNTLTGFGEELTDQEISALVQELSDLISKEGTEAGFARGGELIRAHPSCDALILRVAQTLDIFGRADAQAEEGQIFSAPVDPCQRRWEQSGTEEARSHRQKLLSWYELVASGQNQYLAELARVSMVTKYMEQEEYEKAQKLLDELPDLKKDSTINQLLIQASLYFQTGKEQEGYWLYEYRIRQNVQELSGLLTMLMEKSLERGTQAEAEEFGRLIRKTAELFDQGDYQSWMPEFYLGLKSQDTGRTLDALEKMMEGYEDSMTINSDSILYRHMKKYPMSEEMKWEMKEMFCRSFQNDRELDFLREEKRFQRLMEALGRK